MKYHCCAKVNKVLKSLNLSWNGVDERTSVVLASSLRANSSLKSLDVSRTKIDSQSVERLVKALARNSTLSVLKVRCFHRSTLGYQDVKSTLFRLW